MPKQKNYAILLMVVTMLIFSIQDGISRYLASSYNVLMIVMIRYWIFALFAIYIVISKKTSEPLVYRSRKPILQTLRGLILVCEVCILVYSFTLIGLAESHAVFAIYPLIIVLLSGIFLNEKNNWKIWAAMIIGFLGVMIILNPKNTIISLDGLIPLLSASLFAIYAILTRKVSEQDSPETSFVWTGVIGGLGITFLGPFYLEPMLVLDVVLLIFLCVAAISGHFLFIKALAISEAGTLQPFAYFQLLFASIIGVTIFSERISSSLFLGAFLIVIAGLLSFFEGQKKPRSM